MSRSNHSQAALSEIQRSQCAWAEQREIDLDAHGRVVELERNFFAPLAAQTRAELAAGGEGRLADPGKPPEMAHLESTSALVCNFFDPWRVHGCRALADACGADADEPELRFAEELPIAPLAADALARPIDVLIAGNGARPTAVVATFAEPYHRRDAARTDTPGFFTRPGIWGQLEGCRNLAQNRSVNSSRFQRLNVDQLLQQSLALSNRYGVRGFRLLLLWYELPGQASDQLRREIERFRMRVGGDVEFEALTWQALFAQILPCCDELVGYADYHLARYFPGAR